MCESDPFGQQDWTAGHLGFSASKRWSGTWRWPGSEFATGDLVIALHHRRRRRASSAFRRLASLKQFWHRVFLGLPAGFAPQRLQMTGVDFRITNASSMKVSMIQGGSFLRRPVVAASVDCLAVNARCVGLAATPRPRRLALVRERRSSCSEEQSIAPIAQVLFRRCRRTVLTATFSC